MAPSVVRLHVLGALDVRDENGAVIEAICAQPKRAALLAYLTVAGAHGVVRRDTLLALFWPESTEVQARRALNQAVHYLRSTLGAEVLVSQGADSIGVRQESVWCDALAFDDALSRSVNDEALRLYRGPFLEGFGLDGLLEFDEWADGQRRHFAARAADAAWACADAAVVARNAHSAIELGRRALAYAPGEHSTRRLIQLLDRLGDRAAALREYEMFSRRLRSEYDADPAPETQALIAAVRAREEGVPDSRPPALVVIGESAAEAVEVSEQVVRHPRPRRTRMLAGVVAVTVVAAVAMRMNQRPGLRGAPIGDARTVAVFPFEYRGGKDLGYLGEGVASLIASDLATGGFRTIDSRAVGAVVAHDAKLTLDGAAKHANEFAAGLFVLGDVTESGGRLRVDATLFDRTGAGETVRARAEGSPENLFEIVDALTRDLMKGREDSSTTDLYRSAALTTHSIDALRAYTAAERAMRAGQYEEAVQSFRRAVDLDSTFTLAYYGLSTAANWTGEGTLAGWAARGALAHLDRLSARDRARVEAWDSYLNGDAETAEARYAKVLEENPSDIEALFHQADLHFHWGSSYGRPVGESKAEWRRVTKLDAQNAGALLHAARVAAATQDRVWFDSLVQRLDSIGADAARAAELRALRAFAFGDHGSRVAAAEGLKLIPENVRRGIFQIVASTSRGLNDVAEVLAPVLFFEHTFMSFEDGQMLVVAQSDLARGHLSAARARLDSVMILRPRRAREFRALFATLPIPAPTAQEQRAALAALDRPLEPADLPKLGEPLRLFLHGVLNVRLGDTTGALKDAASLERYVSSEVDATAYAQRYARLVRAEVLRAERRPQSALAVLGDPHGLPDRRLPFVWSYPLAHERFLRAELLAELGRDADAIRWYETFPDPNAYDFMFLPAATLARARLLERQSRPADARRAYEAFEQLWATADASLRPTVDAIHAHAASLSPR